MDFRALLIYDSYEEYASLGVDDVCDDFHAVISASACYTK